jgi:hypothetical protein
MRKPTFVLITLLIFSFLSSIEAQRKISRPLELDSTFLSRQGKVYKDLEFEARKHRPFVRFGFVSNPMKVFNDKVKEVDILESYGYFNEKGIKDSSWTIINTHLLLNLKSVVLKNEISLSHTTLGNSRHSHIMLRDGRPHGYWITRDRKITNNKYSKPVLRSFSYFENGIMSGTFFAEFEGVEGEFKINGSLDENGYLDGILTLEYKEGNNFIEEHRKYRSGFLLELDKFYDEGCILYNEIEYADVIQNLLLLENPNGDANFKFSDGGFGILFNIGYRDNDERIYAQKPGNALFHYFLKELTLGEDKDLFFEHPPEFPLTRKFEFVYPEYEGEILSKIQKQLSENETLVGKYLGTPKFVLDKEKSDSLSYIYAFMVNAQEKLTLGKDLIGKINDGYFKYRSRDLYFQNGIEGFSKPDTIEYIYNQKKRTRVYNSAFLIKDSQDLLIKLKMYFNELETLVDDFMTYTQKQVTVFEQQATIDSLDKIIVDLNEEFLLNLARLESNEKSKKPDEYSILYKLYLVFNQKVIGSLKLNYISEDEFHAKRALGEELVCMLNLLIHEDKYFTSLEEVGIELDKMFTVFTENPFFDRKAETKILGNVQRAGFLLIQYYIEEMYKAESCSALMNGVKQIENAKLKMKKVLEKNDIEAFNLDRALRRERVPSRIERILGI